MFFGCDMKYGRCYGGPTDSLPMFQLVLCKELTNSAIGTDIY